MKTVMQQNPTHDPEKGQIGDCIRAAIASILDLPLYAVPHFGKKHWPDIQACSAAIETFLAKRGLMLLQLPYPEFAPRLRDLANQSGKDCYHLIFGVDHEGDGHACVGLNGHLVHDPHPLQRGFANPPEQWEIGLMVSRLDGSHKKPA